MAGIAARAWLFDHLTARHLLSLFDNSSILARCNPACRRAKDYCCSVSRLTSSASRPACWTRSAYSAPASANSAFTVSEASRTLCDTAPARSFKSAFRPSLNSPTHSSSRLDLARAPATVAPIARPTAPRTSGCRSIRSDNENWACLNVSFFGSAWPSRSNISRAPATPSSNRSFIVSAAPDIASDAAMRALRTVSLMLREARSMLRAAWSCIWEARTEPEVSPQLESRRPLRTRADLDKRRDRVPELVATHKQPQRPATDQRRRQ